MSRLMEAVDWTDAARRQALMQRLSQQQHQAERRGDAMLALVLAQARAAIAQAGKPPIASTASGRR